MGGARSERGHRKWKGWKLEPHDCDSDEPDLAPIAIHVMIKYRVRRTVQRMLQDRGYSISDAQFKQSVREFSALYFEASDPPSLDIYTEKIAEINAKIAVYFPDDEKVGVAVIKRYAEDMMFKRVNNAILVIKHQLTTFGRQCIREMTGLYNLEIFQDMELVVNIMDNVMVPKHVPLSSEEKAALMQQYSLSQSQVPHLKSTDPVARYYGFKIGQLLKVERLPMPPEDKGSTSYRIVV